MKAAIIAVGTEMLGPTRLDTNSLKLTSVLERHGVPVLHKSVVPDDHAAIVGQVRTLLGSFEILLITGGLGPTEDDLTREAVAEACHLRLEEDSEILRNLEERFRSHGMTMSPTNARQAQVFMGQKTLINRRGTAPGFHLTLQSEGRARNVWLFPGVPWELEGMIEQDLEPWVAALEGRGKGLFRRIIKVAGLPESEVEEMLGPFYRANEGEPVTVLASQSEIQIHLQASGNADDAFTHLMRLENALREIFGNRIYGIDDDLLEEVIGRLLILRGQTLATAESCTGGLLGSRLTDVPGSSAYYQGGVVTYARKAKVEMLGLDPSLIEAHGEVSEEVARAMAEGVRTRFGTDWGIGITGVAGPSGGTAVETGGNGASAIAGNEKTSHRKLRLPPPRERIKHLSTQVALDLLRRKLAGGEGER